MFSFTICFKTCTSFALISFLSEKYVMGLATVVSHAPGFWGMPSPCQRSSALTSAASARSKSSNWLIGAARTRPCSSRKVFSICAVAVILLLIRRPQWADLNRTVLCGGNLLCPANRFVEVFAVKHKVSTQLFVCFGERAIREQRFAFSDAHSCRVRDGVNSIARSQHPRGGQFLPKVRKGLPN